MGVAVSRDASSMQREYTSVAVRHSLVLYFHSTSVDRTTPYTGASSATLPSFAPSKLPVGPNRRSQSLPGAEGVSESSLLAQLQHAHVHC
jgi:hypothetical protein